MLRPQTVRLKKLNRLQSKNRPAYGRAVNKSALELPRAGGTLQRLCSLELSSMRGVGGRGGIETGEHFARIIF